MTVDTSRLVKFEEFWAIARPIPTVRRMSGNDENQDDDGKCLSLRQVASVYTEVWQALVATKNQQHTQPASASSTDEACLLAKIIHEIMMQRSNDEATSGTTTTGISPFAEINKIVLPLLPSQPSEDFVDAILDLFFPIQHISTTKDNRMTSSANAYWDDKELEEFLESWIQNDIQREDGTRQQKNSSMPMMIFYHRVLRRLQEYQPDNSIIWKSIARHIIQGLQLAPNKRNHAATRDGWTDDTDKDERIQNLHRRRIITDLLLPVFSSSSSSSSSSLSSSIAFTDTMSSGKKEALDFIWITLWDNETDSYLPLSSLTTVACAILPICVGISLPIVSDNTDANPSAPPIQHKPIWSFIRRCLAQGITEFEDKERQYDSLYRRRGLYLLRTLLDHQSIQNKQHQTVDDSVWNMYVAVFELFEMESEQHLVDQAWDTMIEILAYVSPDDSMRGGWDDWKRLLLARTLVSPETPILRKYGLSRFLQGHTGMQIASSQRMITVEFLFTIVIPSVNSLVTSLGTNIVLQSTKKFTETQDMLILLSGLLASYLKHCIETVNVQQIEELLVRLWSVDMMVKVHRKLAVKIFQAVEDFLKSENQNSCLSVSDDMLQMLIESYRLAVANGAMVPLYQRSILKAVATILQYSKPTGTISSITLLKILAMFPVRILDGNMRRLVGSDPITEDDSTTNSKLWWIDQDSSLVSLGIWLLSCETATGSASISVVGATVAKAFVDGSLGDNSSSDDAQWDPKSGCSSFALEMAKAIGLLCVLPSHVLSCDHIVQHQSIHSTEASELLWPAIHKGLSCAPIATSSSGRMKASEVTRALLLLETGVKLQVLSGVGNGELIIDRVTNQMLPPPSNIEALLSNAASFIFYHTHALFPSTGSEAFFEQKHPRGASRSGAVKVLCSTFVRLTVQLHFLSKGFLSSMAISAVVDSALEDCLKVLFENVSPCRCVENLAILFLALSGGASVDDTRCLSAARTILDLNYDEWDSSGEVTQATRSIFHFAKWSSLSNLLFQLKNSPSNDEEMKCFLDDIFLAASVAVESSPQNTILPIFQCLLKAANSRFSDFESKNTVFDDISFLAKIIDSMFSLLDNAENGIDFIHMLDRICELIFCPSFLLDEYKRLESNGDCETPIRDSFRRLIKMAGTRRPHIGHIAISRICAGWSNTADQPLVGISAIPYR
jgi:hypothetical protein